MNASWPGHESGTDTLLWPRVLPFGRTRNCATPTVYHHAYLYTFPLSEKNPGEIEWFSVFPEPKIIHVTMTETEKHKRNTRVIKNTTLGLCFSIIIPSPVHGPDEEDPVLSPTASSMSTRMSSRRTPPSTATSSSASNIWGCFSGSARRMSAKQAKDTHTDATPTKNIALGNVATVLMYTNAYSEGPIIWELS